jgi:hypothetical protein
MIDSGDGSRAVKDVCLYPLILRAKEIICVRL